MSAARGTSGTRSTTAKTILLGVAATLVLVIVGGGVVWTMMCPCETTPGFVLLGDSHADPVTDWSFANDVSLCQIQISIMLRPHAVNVNCMATPEGDLFISCSFGDNTGAHA